MKFYRYEWVEYASMHDDDYNYVRPSPNPKIRITVFKLLKETKKGYWIAYSSFSDPWKKWVSKESKKRFAYPSKEEALNNFVKRTTVRMSYLQHTIDCCKIALREANFIEQELKKVDIL